ncbi:uncharacterized protein K460DRAFT_411117 [Cucurbitaria berberidis CBS 394.84]|uniref:DUF6594 domain-containing protein n=1 Tax=Cucurbitaria berberidis CBS 394.84 TaxID=1168544 RepID=A0A9P4G875_9PLEO|nr:uncharacterized protein K460DRAFT_411117 [Cucurbitaria berberidis CBS 394.84]KAF1840534.1 hypothetical protein K460DRAFT_411117 [Cucurbitaria berberidis CBS 394.84]
MTTNRNLTHDFSGPTVQERITCLFEHSQLFDIIADKPQAGICQRYGRGWSTIIAYIESEVNQSQRAAELFIRENAQVGRGILDERRKEKAYKKVMNKWMGDIFRHERAFRAARQMALSDSPSKEYMRKYRSNSGSGKGGTRAANGELMSIYGQENELVPSDLTTLDDEELEPIANFIVDWLMNPFVDYIGTRFQRFWHKLLYGKMRPAEGDDIEAVNARTISAIARAFVSVMAILFLVAPIATLDSIQQPKLRILVMALFGQLFATSAQFMGSRSVPLYMLITAYFQAMVVFLGTTSVQNVRQ